MIHLTKGLPATGTALARIPIPKSPAPLSSTSSTGSSLSTGAPGPGTLKQFEGPRPTGGTRTTGALGPTEGDRAKNLIANLMGSTDGSGASRTATGCITYGTTMVDSTPEEVEADPTEIDPGEEPSSPTASDDLDRPTAGSRHLDVGTPRDSIEDGGSPTPRSMPPLETPPASDGETTLTFFGSESDKGAESMPPLETPTGSNQEGTFTFSPSKSEPKSGIHSTERDQHREYHTWVRERHMEVSSNIYSSSKILRQHSDKAERGNAFYVYNPKQIEEHAKKFEGACAYIITEANLDYYGRQELGCPDGTLYVSTVDGVADVLESSGGDVAEVNKKLGVNWPLDSVLKVITIEDPKKFLITMSAGNEHTANSRFKFGSKTEGDVDEAVLHAKVPKGAYTEKTTAQFLAEHRAKKESS